MGVWFWLELFKNALESAWSDMGTNGLGWVLAVGIPLVVTMINALEAPKGSRLAAVRKKWRSELGTTVKVWVAVVILIAAWEAVWKIPHDIRQKADTSTPPVSQVRPVPAPELLPSPKGEVPEAKNHKAVQLAPSPSPIRIVSFIPQVGLGKPFSLKVQYTNVSDLMSVT
ncbi:MAG: hypothetical protein WBO19_16055 [Terriglobia bacterium]|jgi:hypothetical protein